MVNMLDYNGGMNKQKRLKLGRHINDKKSFELFRNVVYVLDDSLPELMKARLRKLLLNNGGTPGESMCDSDDETMSQETSPNLYVSQNRLYPPRSKNAVQSVTPLWVEKAVSLGFIHDLSCYSPVLNQFLSGVVLLLLDLPDEDCDSIKNEIKRYGGQYRDDLSDDLTHLICLDPRGTQYTQCIEQNIPAVLPHWLDDCFRFKKRMETTLYRFPDPVVYFDSSPTPPTLFPYFDQETMTNDEDDYDMVFEDEVIYFGKDIKFKEGIKSVLVEAINRAGGVVLDQYSHQHVTIVVLKNRTSHECRMASKDKKLIASLWWVTNTLSRRYCCSPLSTLLDFPTPPGGLPGMENNVMSVAGYGNVPKYYIRRLITTLGAKYDPRLTSETTHLICGKTSSEIYIEAENSGDITIINHLWLEDCYQHWEYFDCTTDDRYSFISKDKLLETTVGKAHLLDTELERWMHLNTTPAIITHDDENKQTTNSTAEKGSIHVRKRRKAAVDASSRIYAIMPDANAYEKERSRSK